MKVHKWKDLKARLAKDDPVRAERVRRRVDEALLELNLKAMRELVGKTQIETAKKAAMSQSEISKVERRADFLLSTLKRYVEALGGELEVVARFGDKSVRLRGV